MPVPSPAEARAALAEAEQARAQTRLAIAQAMVAPNLIWWGIVWLAIFSYAQFHTGPNNLWWVIIVVGFVGMGVVQYRYPGPVKRETDWRMFGFWIAIFGYEALLLWAVEPWSLLQNLSAADELMVDHKITAYFSIFSMFAYVLVGIWVGRFFVWLGLLVTALILLGFYFLPGYFYFWVGLTGGGALMLSGLFIRKFWK